MEHATGPGPAGGGQRWTTRQRQVLDLVAKGCTNPQIAQSLGISLAGAKWHVSELLSRTGLISREELAEHWRRERSLRRRVERGLQAMTALALPKAAGITAVVAAAAAASAVGLGIVYNLVSEGDAGDPSPAIPPAIAATPTPAGAGAYTVRAGDTCASIAGAFNLTFDELLRANSAIDANCTNLRAGETLRIAGVTPAAGTGGHACPLEAFYCEEARRVARLVAARDFGALFAGARTSVYTCPGVPAPGAPARPSPVPRPPSQGLYDVCSDAQPGDRLEVLPIAAPGGNRMQFTLAVFTRDVPVLLVVSPRLMSIGCPDGKTCDRGFVVVFATEPGNFAYLAFDRDSGTTRLNGAGYGGEPDYATVVNGGPGEAVFGSAVYYPLP